MKKTSLAKRANSLINKPEEGIILSKKDQREYQFITISHSQIRSTIEGLTEVIQAYKEYSETVVGVIREVIEMQQTFAEQLRGLFRGIEAIREMTLLIQIPIKQSIPDFRGLLDLTGYNYIPQEKVRIFVQPNTPFEPQKSLSSSKRKFDLLLTSVQIIGNGFMVEGEYIKGMTRNSEVGRLFELMVRSDFRGVIPDDLFNSIMNGSPLEVEERARSFVLRDLKEILAGNKLKLNLTRYRGIQAYHVKSVTKYIRAPKKAKQLVAKTKIN
ncbi:MAG: hypothetical protein WA061_05835 [Microgenomates group bacterium]